MYLQHTGGIARAGHESQPEVGRDGRKDFVRDKGLAPEEKMK